MLVCVIGNFDPEDPGHAAIAPGLERASGGSSDLDVRWVTPESISEDGVLSHLQDADAVFGAPGPINAPDGYLDAIEFAREGGLPYFGCELGMDLGAVEFARRVLTIATAHSTEFESALRDAVIIELVAPEVIKGKPTEIFGDLTVRLAKDSKLRGWLKSDTVREEHRSRYGLQAQYKTPFTRAGMKIAATDETQLLVRALELTGHPFFVLTSFAPQLRPESAGAHPVFVEFLKAIG